MLKHWAILDHPSGMLKTKSRSPSGMLRSESWSGILLKWLGMGQYASVVIPLLLERFQAGHVWFKVFLVVPPAADRRSIKWLSYLRVGRRVYALGARVLVKLQDLIFKAQSQKLQHRAGHLRQVVHHLLIADMHRLSSHAWEHRPPEVHHVGILFHCVLQGQVGGTGWRQGQSLHETTHHHVTRVAQRNQEFRLGENAHENGDHDIQPRVL